MAVAAQDVVFPCEGIPAEAHIARLLGLYPQRQEGLWMQRIRIPGGQLTAGQWRALAKLARDFTPSTPLHLTTRQDVELHDLTAERVPAVQSALEQVGLSTVGACGDTLRNVTVCPGSGLRNGVDLRPLGRQIHRTLLELEGIFSLPRKFKISLSVCKDACAQPWINDLGLVVHRRGGQWGFRVIVGGSLGPRPATGVELTGWLASEDVLPLVTAAVEVFAEHGDRENRARARLRHVRQRLGDEPFKALLWAALSKVRPRRDWPKIELPEISDGVDGPITLTFSCGHVPPEAADALADLAERDGACLVLSNHHRIQVYGRDLPRLRSAVEAAATLRCAAAAQPAIVACPGTRWCSRALTNTNDLAEKLRQGLAGKLPPGATVCISGCPNGCAQSTVADVGLVGRLATLDGVKQEVYDLYVGGEMGRGAKLAEARGTKLSADETLREILRALGGEAL